MGQRIHIDTANDTAFLVVGGSKISDGGTKSHMWVMGGVWDDEVIGIIPVEHLITRVNGLASGIIGWEISWAARVETKQSVPTTVEVAKDKPS